MCHWQIKDGDRQLAHSESPDEQMHKALALLNYRRLNEILLNSWVTQDGDVMVIFSTNIEPKDLVDEAFFCAGFRTDSK